jgi:hypothetical protein
MKKQKDDSGLMNQQGGISYLWPQAQPAMVVA